MAGKKDIVEQALKLIAGGVKEAGPSVAERAAKNIDVFNTANRLGVDTNDIAKLQETKRLMDYHKGFIGDVRERAKSANEIVQQMRASGAFPMEIGTRYTTEHSRRTGQGPWTVTNYYVDPKNPQGSYGYYVRRELPDGGYEESVSKIRDPKLEALHGPERWEELQRGFVPMTGPKVVKAYGGSIREGYGPGGWVDDVVKMAGKVISGEGDDAAKAVGIIPGTFPGKKLPRVDALANNVDKFVYHSGVAEDIPSMKHGVDPQIGPWVTEVLEGFAEDDLVNEVMENAVPVSWWSKRPDWAVMKVARKLGKNPRDVTPEELAQHGHVALIPKKDPEAESMYWVGEQGLSSGPYSEVEDITGRKLKAYEADLYSGNYGPEGVERNEYITPRSVEPYLHLTGDDLVEFLRKTGDYNKASGGRIAKGPGGWLDDVVKMAGKVISGEGENAAKAGIRAYQGSPHNFAAERLVRFPTGKEEYLVGQPDVLPDVPEGAEVLQDFPLGRMRMDKIGTGEGAQAYGHGLYAAESEPIAWHYRHALAGAPEVQYKGNDYALPAALNELKEWRTANPEGSAYLESLRKKTMEDAAKILLENVGGGSDAPGVLRNLVNSFPSAAQDTAKGWVEQAEKLIKPHLTVNEPGHMYEVNINADPDSFLDWDKPLSEQPEVVRRTLEKLIGGPAGSNQVFDDMFNAVPLKGGGYEYGADGGRAYKNLDTGGGKLSEMLREAGIPGIKYLDAGSRYTPANLPDNPIANEARRFLEAAQGDSAKALQLFRDSNPVKTWAGPERDEIIKVIKAAAVPVTRNYVVFDDKLISIIRKYGIAGASAMLGYNLMEQLDPKQALAASMADQDYQSSRPQRSMGGNNSISGALNVARGLNGGR